MPTPIEITGSGFGASVNGQVNSLGVGAAADGTAGDIALPAAGGGRLLTNDGLSGVAVGNAGVGILTWIGTLARPASDAAMALGTSALRFSNIFCRALLRPVQALVSGATPAVDASLGDHCFLSILTNIAVTIGIPANPPAAGHKQRLTFEIKNGTAGALTTPPAFNAGAGGFKVTSALPALAAGQRYLIAFVYSQDAGFWIQDSVAPFVY